MKDLMGIIHHLKNEEYLAEMTHHRCLASVPFGGRYRLVDFVLSNLVNAGIGNIAIITSLNLRSLIDHLGKGKEWGLDRKQDGLFILPTAVADRGISSRKVDLEDFYFNADYLRRSKQKYVFISGSNIICNLDLKKAFQFHKEKKAQITMIYSNNYSSWREGPLERANLKVDGFNRVIELGLGYPEGAKRGVSMDMYIMEKDFLTGLLTECAHRGEWDLVGDWLVRRMQDFKIYGYAYDGYLAIIDCVENYYKHHMDLLEPRIWQEIFFRHGLIYTKTKDGPPAKYTDTAEVHNVLMANGCIIEGKVENSILFRGVQVKKGAAIRNSIIMQEGVIEEDCILDRVILDKYVHITRGAMLMGENDAPLVVGKNSLI